MGRVAGPGKQLGGGGGKQLGGGGKAPVGGKAPRKRLGKPAPPPAPPASRLELAAREPDGRAGWAVRRLLDEGADPAALGPALHAAVSAGALRVAEQLLEAGADPEEPGGAADRRSPIERAVDEDRPGAAALLLDRAEEPDAAGEAALLRAAAAGSARVARMLLEERGAAPAGEALLAAAQHGREAVAVLLLERGADPASADFLGRSAAELALDGRHGATMEALVARGVAPADLGALSLAMASAAGLDALVRQRLDEGEPADAMDRDNDLPLALAARRGRVGATRLLLAAGAPTEYEQGDGSALLVAVMNDRAEVARELLDHGTAWRDLAHVGTLLHAAAARTTPGVVARLLDLGLAADAPGMFGGATPVVEAAAAGRADNVRLLLARGAGVPAAPFTFRDSCEDAARVEVARVLLAHGAAPRVLQGGGDAVARTLAVEHGVPPADNDGGTFAAWWREGTHPVQLERAAVERAALAACPGMPRDVAMVAGGFVAACDS